MPYKPKRPCNHPRCPELTTERFCAKHAAEYQRQQDKQRGTAHQRGYNYRWRKARKFYLKRYPLCVRCQRENRLTPATEVDHVIAHKGDYFLFWDESNWQSLCKTCHSKKTAKEDGGFGK